MPKTARKTTRRHSPKRAAVLEAASELFLAHGFRGTSMDRIAEAAKVSKRTVYDHFPSKEDLFEAICQDILQQVEQMPRHSYSAGEPLDAQLRAIGNAFAQTICDPKFMKLSRVAISRYLRSAELAADTNRAYARLRRDMIAFFKAGKRDGRLRIPNPERAAAQFAGLIKELAYWPELMAGAEPLSARERQVVVKAAVDMFLAHYRA